MFDFYQNVIKKNSNSCHTLDLKNVIKKYIYRINSQRDVYYLIMGLKKYQSVISMDRWSRIDRRKFGHSCISVLRSCAMCAVLRQIQRWKQLQRRDTRPLSVFRGQRKMKNRPSYSRLLLYEISLAFALWCWQDHLDRGREKERRREKKRKKERERFFGKFILTAWYFFFFLITL